MSKKIVIDTDPGIDDAMAILLAFNSPEVEVVGLTTIFGNVTTAQGAQNALRLVEMAGQPHVPVAQGAAVPLVQPSVPPADFVHGADGFGNVNLASPRGQAIDRTAAQFIVEMVMNNPGEITLVPIGPLTNIALALKLEPRIAQHTAEVVQMGGAATVNGNVNPAAEANILNDAYAADIVFNAGWPVVMVGLDVTMKTVMDEPYMASLCSSCAGQFIYDITRFYEKFHYEWDGIRGCHTHDPSAVAYLIDPTLFTVETGAVRVLTEGIARGMTLMDREGKWAEVDTPWSGKPRAKVCVDVDDARLLELFHQRIQGAG